MAQVRRKGQPHVRPIGAYRAVHQRPTPVDTPRQQGCVFIFRLHDLSQALEVAEIAS
jgi:hypothetical protein